MVSQQHVQQVHDIPSDYENLNEIAAPSPVQSIREDLLSREQTLEGQRSQYGEDTRDRRALSNTGKRGVSRASRNNEGPSYDIPDDYQNLDEVTAPSPVQTINDTPEHGGETLEHVRSQQSAIRAEELDDADEKEGGKPSHSTASRTATKVYTVAYLIFFSFLGTLARLGLQAITFYPGAPSVYGVLWANFAGSLFMGFLSEDRMLFKYEWGTPRFHQLLERATKAQVNDTSEQSSIAAIDLGAAKKEHAAVKKTIPLYIGLATGFCGSFTSFSSFIRDVFLALANELPTPLDHPADYGSGTSTTSTVPRNGGYSFMALLSILIVTISTSLSGLFVGAHLAIFLEPYTPSFSIRTMRKIIDPLVVFLAWGCWLGAVLLAIFPPDRNASGSEVWRGRAVFAVVFAPLGCLGRFYASLYLNPRMPSFPLGTFAVNIFGTAILGMSYDLQHVPLGGVVGCQVLQGIEDGFCGCLTTVSTWVAELSSLRRSHAYRYGAVSVLAALGCLVVIMGSMAWTRGFSAIMCVK